MLGQSSVTTVPLQIVVFRHPDDKDVVPYENSIVRAFQGGKESGGYLATGEDLGVQLEIFADAPPKSAAHLLDAFCHSMVIVFADTLLLQQGKASLFSWLTDCWAHVDSANGRHRLLVVGLDERQGRSLIAKCPSLESLQLFDVQRLGEFAVRPAMLALRVLHESRMLLANALPIVEGEQTGFLRLFISHAKVDGLPLAQALKHLIKAFEWLDGFYDADDLPAGRNWRRELEKGVGSSLIVMLRTEAYDGRYWCKQEVLWADEYATPAVLVDARTNLDHPAGALPFERVPSVRIPDGNLLRILFLALREGLRFLHFMRRVEQMKHASALPAPLVLRVFSYPPSMSALLRACRSLSDSTEPHTTPRMILYPDPPLRSGTHEAALALVQLHAPAGTRLVTPFTLAATTVTL